MDSVLAKKDYQILWLVKILLAACLALPLLAASAFIFPYTAPKAFVFRILVEVAAVFYFYLALKYPQFRPKKTALSLAVLTLLLISFLSALAGVDFYSSWWGNLERMLGVWGLGHFVLFFILLGAVFKTEKEWRALLRISVGVSSLVALLAIFQKFTDLGWLMPQSDRVFGTIGNAALLASYLIFNIFFTGYLSLRVLLDNYLTGRSNPVASGINTGLLRRPAPRNDDKKYWSSIIYGLLFIANLVALLLTGTRGAFLGLGAGTVFCLAVFGGWHPQKNLRKYFLTALILILLLAGLVFVFRDSALVQKNSALQRLTTISLKDTTAQNRLLLWQKAWAAWQAKPIFGWGPENYEVAANQHFDPRLNPYEAWYDRAHNFIFDYGVTAGWLGLVSYLGLLGVTLFYLRKVAKENFNFSVIFSALVVAYLVQNFFVFDAFVSYLMLFFALGLINFYYLSGREVSLFAETKKGLRWPSRAEAAGKRIVSPHSSGSRHGLEKKDAGLSFNKKIFLGVLIIAIIFSLYSFSLKLLSASYLANQILSLEAEEAGEAEWLLAKALSLETFVSGEIAYQVTLDYLDKINRAPQLTQNENFYKVALGALGQSIERSPWQVKNYVALAWLNLYFSDQHRERISEALALAQKAKQLAPAKKDAYLILVAGWSVFGQSERALEIVKEVQGINDSLGAEVRNYWENLNK